MNKFGIVREPGESEADYQRRYGREKMRHRRALKPKSTKKRGKGKAPLKNSLLTEEEWLAMRQQPEESEEDWKRRAGRERMRIWRAREGNKEIQLARRRAEYAANPEKHAAKRERDRREHPERAKKHARDHFDRNRDQKIAALTNWVKSNPEKFKEAQRRWNEVHPHMNAFYSAKWRKQARIATPAWADFDQIAMFYEEARRISEETGIAHHVDHIIPLQGKTVCGLHVQTNLRVIPAVDNVRKRATLDHDLAVRAMFADLDVV